MTLFLVEIYLIEIISILALLFIFFISRRKTKIIDPFKPNVPFLHPQKMSENQRFSDILRGYRDRTLGQNGLKPIFLFSCKENKNMTLLQLQCKV